MKAQVKRVFMLVVGWAFILLGIAGLFLPVLQGILFLLIGLFILSSEYVWAHHLLHKLKERFPTIATHFEHARQRAERWMGGAFHHKTEPKPKAPGAEPES
jgi:uncharacterized protein